MLSSSLHRLAVPSRPRILAPQLVARVPSLVRYASRYEAFDSGLDPDDLRAAREWRKAFTPSTLPKGSIAYSRSSGPGGQHVNKTETKATTTWTAGELMGMLPKLLQGKVRSSRYYAKSSDTIMIQAQAQRSRNVNADENHQKLYDELVKIYDASVPGETDATKKKKYKEVEKAFHENRIREKKQRSSKKQSRRGGRDD